MPSERRAMTTSRSRTLQKPRSSTNSCQVERKLDSTPSLFCRFGFSSEWLSIALRQSVLGEMGVSNKFVKSLLYQNNTCQYKLIQGKRCKGGSSDLSLSAICMASSLEWVPLLKPFTSCSSNPSSNRMASLFTPLLLARTSGVEPLWLLFKCK